MQNLDFWQPYWIYANEIIIKSYLFVLQLYPHVLNPILAFTTTQKCHLGAKLWQDKDLCQPSWFYANYALFPTLDFGRFLICHSRANSEGHSENIISITICFGSNLILTGLLVSSHTPTMYSDGCAGVYRTHV